MFGIPIAIHYSWLVIFALVVWSLGADYFVGGLFERAALVRWIQLRQAQAA